MITLYAHPSRNALKVQIFLQEVGLQHNLVDTHTLEKGTPDDAIFRRASPIGQAPALYDPDTDVALFESSAILIYLAEKTGRFLPGPDRPQARAETLKWLIFEAANLCPAMLDIYHYAIKADAPHPYAEDRARTLTRQALGVLDGALNLDQGRDFLAGEYSIADMILYPWMTILEDLADIALGDYPALTAWAARMVERPAVQIYASA